MSDAITLVGLSGSGKSTVGAALARQLERPFVDLDALIGESAEASPGALIERYGEAHFRELERRALEEACSIEGVVIATGGGAVIDPLNRWLIADAGISIWLDAPDDILLARLAGHKEARPMLAGDPAEALAGLRLGRSPYYRAADLHVDVNRPLNAAVGAVVELVAGARPSGRLFEAVVPRPHPMGPAEATVVLGRDLARDTYAGVLDQVSTGTAVVAADRRAAAALPELMAALPVERLLLFPAGERLKRLRAVERLLEAASAMGAERGDAWVGVGGGTATDLVGATAALYLRGTPFVALPTTWLGMADASVGGKVAVDLSAAKNAAGAFWPPVAIVGDVASLRTLTRSQRRDGMAESLKSGLIGDPALWALVETRGKAALGKDEAARYAAVERAVHLKLDVVERDPFEQGERRNLNLGHTLGHALEIESGYRLPHGQAVILGLRAVASIAAGRGAESDLAERIDSVANDLGYALHREFDPSAVRTALGSDKKRHKGRQRWILPMAVGRVEEADDITEAELERAMGTISMDASAGLTT
jgi:shikimate kinase/3-dehydroquinate synthase